MNLHHFVWENKTIILCFLRWQCEIEGDDKVVEDEKKEEESIESAELLCESKHTLSTLKSCSFPLHHENYAYKRTKDAIQFDGMCTHEFIYVMQVKRSDTNLNILIVCEHRTHSTQWAKHIRIIIFKIYAILYSVMWYHHRHLRYTHFLSFSRWLHTSSIQHILLQNVFVTFSYLVFSTSNVSLHSITPRPFYHFSNIYLAVQ